MGAGSNEYAILVLLEPTIVCVCVCAFVFETYEMNSYLNEVSLQTDTFMEENYWVL